MLQSSDMIYHAKKIVNTLEAYISNISLDPLTAEEKNKKLFDRLINLGRKHHEFGLQSEYYKVYIIFLNRCYNFK